MSNLLRRACGAVLRLTAKGLFLAMILGVVLGSLGWSPGVAERARISGLEKKLHSDLVLAHTPVEATEFDPLSVGLLIDGDVAQPQTLGDDPALDSLWVRCEQGSGYACEQLFTVAPPGSNYEQFGLTCGDRPLVIHCQAELDGRADLPVVEGWPVPFIVD